MDSDDENQDSYQMFGGTNGCVLLIDVSAHMWQDINEEKPINSVLEACKNLVKKMMIDNLKQLVGITFFGMHMDDGHGINNVVQFMPLKEPAVDDVKRLIEFAADPERIKSQWGVTDDFNLADALWQASRMFSACHKKMNKQTVILLSSLQPPKTQHHKSILKKAIDVCELNISIDIVNVSNQRIPADSFFMELGKVISDPANPDWEPPEPVIESSDILGLIWSSNHRRAASTALKMYLGQDVSLGVKLFRPTTKHLPPKMRHLNRDTNDLVVSSSILTRIPNPDDQSEIFDRNSEEINEAYPTPLLKDDLTYFVHYGDRKIEISSLEFENLKNFSGAPCIKILGFMSASVVSMSELYYKPSAFLYPDDNLVEGSSTLFLTLRDRCLALGRVAICIISPRRFSQIRHAALVPQKRVMNGSFQTQPDGFHLVYLPYSDEFKEFPIEEGFNSATQEQIQCVENILNKLKFTYEANTFENPALQTKYKAIEALALDEENPEEIEDTTLPDVQVQDERMGNLSEDFQFLFGSMNISAVKRSNNGDSKPRKKVATEDMELLSAEMVLSKIRLQTLKTYTVPQLKTILKTLLPHPVSVTGLKKDAMIQHLYENEKFIHSS